jgi:eukaryotic-like serine/threonine-protein kinase
LALIPGTRLGPYEITAQIGVGGMGEVYRARDTKLARYVAIKILPDAFAADHDRLSRFQREAQVLASLNHPNIAHIYGLEEAGGTPCIVMELVEGDTLQARLKRGSLPVDDALQIATQIAEALGEAHEKGIIHRDLKPGNVMVLPDGTVKVLDFGLAKALEHAPVGQDFTHAPTVSLAVTDAGMILGTAAYMSPEQAKGQEAERTSDVWAFGCVLYEMLTGRAAFGGASASEIIVEVLRSEPDWRPLPAATPDDIRRLLRRCLQKDRKERLQHIGDARIEIRDARSGPPSHTDVTAGSRAKERLAWLSAIVASTLIAGGLGAWALRPISPPPEIRLEITTPPTTNRLSLAISPDGRKIVFTGTEKGQSRLWLRALDSTAARPLAGTDSANYPFWSPDGRSVGFFADGKLKRLDIEAGSVQTLADASAGRGGAWTGDGVILFAPQAGPIYRISATGGERSQLTFVDAQQRGHRFPQLLPGGRHFLYYTTGSPQTRGVYVAQLEGSEKRWLLDADAAAVYARPGHLLFVRQGTLFAQSFDPVGLKLTGNPFPVARDVAVDSGVGIAALSSSPAGPIVYRTGSARGQKQLAWFDRSGKEIGSVGPPDEAETSWGPSMSPDGRSVGLTRTVDGNQDVWLLDTERGVLRRFTSNQAAELNPIWSPDGSRIVFTSDRQGVGSFFQKSAAGTGSEEPLLTTALAKQPSDWSPDGRFLLYRVQDPKTRYDIWAVRLDGDQKPFPVVQTNFDERDGQFSPDGKWIAYESDESGRFEIYVQPFPGPGLKWPISTNGGAQVRWRHDGKELFYIALDDRLMAVPTHLDSDRQTVRARVPVGLFTTLVGGAVSVNRQQYMVSPDGGRFLLNTVVEGPISPIIVILNWAGSGK